MVRLTKYAKWLLFFPILGLGGLQARANCPSPSPKITFSISYGKIGRLYDDNAYQAPQNANALGHVEGNSELRFRSTVMPGADGCLYISNIHADITITANLKVSNKYPSGSCQHQVVVNHEERHLQVVKSFYTYVPTNFTPVLANMTKGKTGFRADQQASASQIMTAISYNLQKLITDEHQKMQYTYVDSPDMMKRDYAKCPKW